MTNQPPRKNVNARIPIDVRVAAQAVLDHHGHGLEAFVVACLATLADKPDEMLAIVAEKWPAPRPPGRPRKSSGE